MNKQEIEEVRAKFQRTRVCETAGGTLVLRSPTRAEWRKFKVLVMSDDPGAQVGATENLLFDICVYPGRDGLAALLDNFPALEADKGVQAAIKELTGQVQSDEGKG